MDTLRDHFPVDPVFVSELLYSASRLWLGGVRVGCCGRARVLCLCLAGRKPSNRLCERVACPPWGAIWFVSDGVLLISPGVCEGPKRGRLGAV